MGLAWDKYVPDSVSIPTAIPLNWHRLIQQQIPVSVSQVVTASGGTTVNLPADFTSEISAASEYTVVLTAQTWNSNIGELYVGSKTTSSFKVYNSGSQYGDTIGVVVFWIRP